MYSACNMQYEFLSVFMMLIDISFHLVYPSPFKDAHKNDNHILYFLHQNNNDE